MHTAHTQYRQIGVWGSPRRSSGRRWPSAGDWSVVNDTNEFDWPRARATHTAQGSCALFTAALIILRAVYYETRQEDSAADEAPQCTQVYARERERERASKQRLGSHRACFLFLCAITGSSRLCLYCWRLLGGGTLVPACRLAWYAERASGA